MSRVNEQLCVGPTNEQMFCVGPAIVRRPGEELGAGSLQLRPGETYVYFLPHLADNGAAEEEENIRGQVKRLQDVLGDEFVVYCKEELATNGWQIIVTKKVEKK